MNTWHIAKRLGALLIDQAKQVGTHVQGTTIKGSGDWLMEAAPEQAMPAPMRLINARSARVKAAA